MAIESVAITAGTTDAIAVDTVGTVNYQVNKISVAADGAAGSVWLGETRGGTIDSITNIAGGSIVVTAGTFTANLTNVGTVGTIQNINGGSIVVTAGTIASSGTTTGVGVVGNINSGSIVVTAGTIAAHGITAGTLQTLGTVGTIQNLNGGSIVVTAGTLASSGTTTGVGVIGNVNGGSIVVTAGTIASSGTTTGVGVVGNVNGGSIVVTAGTLGTITRMGTIGTIQNINGGSIVVTAGTIAAHGINAGTINVGTFTQQPYPATQVQSAFSVGTLGIGTLVSAAGVGTGIYPTSINITAMSGTLDMCLSFGSATATSAVITRGNFIAGGGIALSFPFPSFFGVSNSPLTYQILGGAGTASWAATYVTKGTP